MLLIPPDRPPEQRNETFHAWDMLRTRGGEWLVLGADALYRLSADRRRLLRHPFQPPVQEAFYRSMTEDYLGNL